MPKVTLEYKQILKGRILESALQAFSKKGYDGTALDDVAEPLGLSKAALYRYYDGKEALFKALAEKMVTASENAVRNAFQEAKFNPSALLSAMKQWTWTPTMFFTAATEAMKNKPLRRIFRSGYESTVGALAKSVDEQKELGVFRKDMNSRHIAMGAIALHDGLLASELAGIGEGERFDALAEVFGVMLDGMLTKQ